MNEHLDFRIRARLDFLYLFKTKLTSDDNALQARLRKKIHAGSTFNVHLRGTVKLKVREKLLAHPDNAEILNDKTVRPDSVQVTEKTVEAFQIALLADSVHGDVNLFILAVERLYRRLKLIPCEIGRTQARIKTF